MHVECALARRDMRVYVARQNWVRGKRGAISASLRYFALRENVHVCVCVCSRFLSALLALGFEHRTLELMQARVAKLRVAHIQTHKRSKGVWCLDAMRHREMVCFGQRYGIA